MSARAVLQSWKEIAVYLDRDVRTCRRWETQLGLPVHRIDGSPAARVFAYKDEIDGWMQAKVHERDAGKPDGVPSTILATGARAQIGPRLPSPRAFVRRWYVTAAFTAVLAIGVLGWRAVTNGRPHFTPRGSSPALVVLPFVNGTGDQGLDYLRESLPDHLTRDLQRSADHLTVFSFDVVARALSKIGLEPGAPLTPDDLAALSAETGAGWFLSGTFSRAGNGIRVEYEVRGARALEPLKKGRLPGTEADITILEDRVADGVRRAFSVPPSAGPEIFSACTIQATRYCEAARAIERKYSVSTSPPDLEKIIGLFNQAREADPGCALAFLGLGDAYQHRFVFEDPDPEALRLMGENYLRAYEMAPERAETNVGVAWIHFFDRDNDQAYAYFKKAMEIDPWSLHVLTETGAFLRSMGLLERAAEYFTRVLQAGGRTADIFMLRAYTYEQMGLYESALADFDKVIGLEPDDFLTRCHRARVLLLMNRFDAAEIELVVAETLEPGDPFIGQVKALAAAARGDRKGALAALELARVAARPTRGTYYRSRVYSTLGMIDEAVATIESALERGFGDVYDYLYFFPFLNNRRDHFYDKLRDDPRFIEILRREELKYAGNLEKYGGL